MLTRPRRIGSIVLATAFAAALPCAAQTLPSGPIRAVDGQLLVSGEVVATIGDRDHNSYFNYTDYEHNALRLFRLALTAAWQPSARLAFIGELRSEDFESPRAYAAYVRVRPWQTVGFDIQAGRIPLTFGSFGRRAYTLDNPLIGYPLAYQYLTSIRPDAVPATTDDLIRMRARGWLSSFPVGHLAPAPGVPLVTAFRWDTGVQANWRKGIVNLTGAITSGTLSDPHVADNNDGRQFSGRLSVEPVPGLIMGASAARGEWLAEDVRRLLPEGSGFAQTAWGSDVEYSRDHWLVRTELVWSRWRVPLAQTAPRGTNLDALAIWCEGRYRFTPRIFAAARVDHLGFSEIWNAAGTSRVSWDAPVDRVELAAGYYLQRNLTMRVGVQLNDRDGGRIRRRTYLSAQVAYWF
jgi:hypothetical protein